MGMTMKRTLLVTCMLLSAAAHAYDGWSSELSHAAGGALLAGAVTHHCRDSHDRAWIGFAVSSAAGVLVEGASIARGGKRSSQYLDMAAHTIGSAIGAWYSDKYLLMPVVNSKQVGVLYQMRY
jgi:hypothetical protein